MSNTTTLNTTTTLSNSRPLADIMQEAIRLDEAAKAVPNMVRYCIMRANEMQRSENDATPTLRQVTGMKKGDKSKVLSLFSSLLLGYSNIEELKLAQADAGTAIKTDDSLTHVIEKETALITVDQFDAARSRIGREINNAAVMEDLAITSATYSDIDQTFYIPTSMWLAPGMTAHGRLSLADTHPLDGKAAIVLVNALPYEIKLGLDYLSFIARLRTLIDERKELPDSPLARTLAKANGLRYIGQKDDTAPQTEGQTAGQTETTPAQEDKPVTPPVDEKPITQRGPEPTPPAYTASHFKKLCADWISASHLFVTECGKIARPADMVTDDFDPHYKDFKNTLAQLNLMHDAILENTARIDAEHAASVAANVAAAREKAFEKAPVSHTRAKSNKQNKAA